MANEEKKKPKNLDDLLDQMKGEHSKDLESSFKAWDAFSKEEHQNHVYNNILYPSQQALYGGIVTELDKIFAKDDDAKLHNKEKEIKKAVVAGLKKYFEKAQPQFLKTMDSYGMDEDEVFDFLTSLYDGHTGAASDRSGKIKSIKDLLGHAKDKKSTVGHLKRDIPEVTAKHIEGALGHMTSLYLNHHFSKYHPTEIAAYLKPHIEKQGFEIKDKVGYAIADLGELLKIRSAVLEKKIHPYLSKKKENQHT